MTSTRRAAARMLVGAFLALVVVVGLVAQAGSYLLGFTTPGAGGETVAAAGLGHAQPGPHPVGVRRVDPDSASDSTVSRAPAPMTAWYPAVADPDDGTPMTYSYALAVLGAGSTTALATYAGTGRLGAAPDLARGPYPLVVLSSGFAMTPGTYAWLAEHLASHGFVVVAPEHPETLDPRNLWRSTIDRPALVDRTRDWVEDAAAPSGDLAGLVDAETVAVLGHSYGGYTALTSGGARVDAEAFAAGCETAATDDPIGFLCDALLPRLDDIADVRSEAAEADPVDAVVSLAGDAAMFGERGLASITAPTLVIGGTGDDDSPYDWSTRLAYDHVASARKVEVTLDGADHFVFAGDCGSRRRLLSLVDAGFCSDPAWDRGRARDVVRHYVAAFLLAELRAERTASVELAPTQPGLAGVDHRAVGY